MIYKTRILINRAFPLTFIYFYWNRIRNLDNCWYVNKKSISPLFWSQPNCILWIWVPGNFRIHVTLSSSRWVSTGETARVSCHQIRHSDSQLLSHQRFSPKQFFKLDKRCMCLHVSITRLVAPKLSPSQTGYFLLFAWKLSYLSSRGFILINPRHLLGALHGLPGQANTRETK